jgi:hypothetical protein
MRVDIVIQELIGFHSTAHINFASARVLYFQQWSIMIRVFE